MSPAHRLFTDAWAADHGSGSTHRSTMVNVHRRIHRRPSTTVAGSTLAGVTIEFEKGASDSGSVRLSAPPGGLSWNAVLI